METGNDHPDRNWHDRAKSVTLPSRPFIDGAYVDARTNRDADCIFPGDGRLLVKVASCGQDDVDAAVKSDARLSNPAPGRACRRSNVSEF
jgi:acyl-CoA reductase-like NAD-dependent aldehyde dehydrogenase